MIRRRKPYPPARIPKAMAPYLRREDEGDCPQHRAFIRSQRCLIDNADCAGRLDPHHVRTAANAGAGMRPPDWFCVPLCRYHHNEGEGILRTDRGWEAFERKYGIDLLEAAARYAARSPALRRTKELA